MIRKIETKDFEHVRKLVDQTFQPKESMVKLFPSLFLTQEKFSYVQEISGKIVSFIGVSPIRYDNYSGVALGAIFTIKDFQGQGLMRDMFPYVLEDLKQQEIDFILVSGAGKVYRENGVVDFGRFKRYSIPTQKNHQDIQLLEYKNDLKGLNKIYTTLSNSDTFDYGVNELAMVLESQPIARLKGYSPVTFTLENGSFLTYAFGDDDATVIEWGGNLNDVIKMVETLNKRYNISLTTLICKDDDPWMADYEYEMIINSGTIITLNQTFDPETLPYCSGYKFI
ncbi:GNAT family N-acetyltransferase [Erysipelothrix urinaevulpis]|uniref:GNAT family N-acetyltransferase n=1 Tax=Erysipelothrix urinaevulpis TaxID=2683717 RepID=UPI00135C9311|nr:GNAT family N-acetyltransferase [Erysipelothrix urinaevulpis]